MIDKIIEIIRQKTENQPNEVLLTQWNASRDYVFQRQNAIAMMFPHYSLHDKSHSEAILTNIERIIGKNTLEEKMSAEDLWLLLCSACYHDLGMYVSGEDQDKLLQDDNFINFVQITQNNIISPLFQYAQQLTINNNKLSYKDIEVNKGNVNALNFLIADYIRKKHSQRAAHCIMSDEQLALHYIPKRLTKILSEICKCHTEDFDVVMQLPHLEKGISVADCHPRYIAFLLRLGDLLDMDNNRFSDVILNTLPSIPIDSLQHKAKHFSVTHLEINSQRVCATATCDDVEVADLTQKWFSMLNEELTRQMMKWSDIVPEASYGFLPTIGELKVNLSEYDTIDGKFKNKFEIEPTKALEIIQGAGLYSSRFQSIREILQNAVDATLLRVFVENEDDFAELSQIEQREKFRKLCKRYPISITFKKYPLDGNTAEFVKWEICIKDNGIGMSQEDIKFLTNTASNSENLSKKTIVQRMPEWMRPSGTFGIGFQSIFLLTDIVEIYSHRINSEKSFSLKLYNPIKEKEGLVLLKTETDNIAKVGTEIVFSMHINAIPTSWSIKCDRACCAFQTLHSYDFVKDHSLDIDIAQIRDEISLFAYASDIPIVLINENGEQKTCASYVNEFQHFSFTQNVEVSAHFSDSTTRSIDRSFYRGQIVEKSIRELRFVDFTINILGGDAKEILTLNRNEIRTEYKSILRSRTLNAIKDLVIDNYEHMNAEEKEWASMFLNFYNSEFDKEIDIERYSEWNKHTIMSADGSQPETFKKILEYPNITFREQPAHVSIEGRVKTPSHMIIDKDTILINYSYNSDDIFFLQHKIIKQHVYSHINSYETDGKTYNEITYCKSEPANVISDIKQWFIHYINNEFYARGYMPCLKKYHFLAIKQDDYTYRPDYIGHFQYIGEIMVCPYIRINNLSNSTELHINIDDQELYQFVYDHRANESVTLEDIQCTYKHFYEDTKQYVEELNSSRK